MCEREGLQDRRQEGLQDRRRAGHQECRVAGRLDRRRAGHQECRVEDRLEVPVLRLREAHPLVGRPACARVPTAGSMRL